MKSRAELVLLPLAALALGGAAPQEMPTAPEGTPSGSSQLQPGEVRVDQVGYARAYEGVTPPRDSAYAAHATLRSGEFVEVTALDNGKTILVAIVEQTALPTGSVVALSPAAASQLGIDFSRPAPVRVRAMAPTAQDEAALAAGGAAPTRLDAPDALLKGLRAQLPQVPAAPTAASVTPAPTTLAPPPAPSSSPTPAPAPKPKPAAAPAPAASVSTPRTGRFLVQVGTFSNASNAKSLATRLGGFTDASGALTRVRMGPFATRAEADAARAKAVAAGYRDAAVVRSN
jgi:rare lipoprotein A